MFDIKNLIENYSHSGKLDMSGDILNFMLIYISIFLLKE